MSRSDFFGLMRHPEWQRKRLEVFEDANFQCSNCGDSETELHVHHKIYKPKTKPWEYDYDELACLCSTCHKKETDRVREIKEILFIHSCTQDVDIVVAALSPYEPKYLEDDKYALLMADIVKKLLFMHGDALEKVKKLVDEHEEKRKNSFWSSFYGEEK